MFGLEVLVWWGHRLQPPSYFQLLKHFLFGGPIGHSALKLTIPMTLENNALIKCYCRKKNGQVRIPHYQTETTILGKETDPFTQQTKYYPIKKPAWVIYFSAWPRGLSYEHQDRLNESRELEVEYEEEWAKYLDVQYRNAITGKAHVWLGKSLSNLLFRSKWVAQPIETIIHPHSQHEALKAKLEHAKSNYLKYLNEFESIFTDWLAVKEQQFVAQIELNQLKRIESSLFFSLHYDKEIFENIKIKAQNDVVALDNHSLEMQTKVNLAQTAMERSHQVFIEQEIKYYSEVATVGTHPDFIQPIPMQVDDRSLLDVENMLKTMRKLMADDFDIAHHNCSMQVYEILLSALPKSLWQLMLDKKWLSKVDMNVPLIATPSHVCDFAQKMSNSLMQYQLDQKVECLAPDVQAPPSHAKPLLHLQRSRKRKTPELKEETVHKVGAALSI